MNIVKDKGDSVRVKGTYTDINGAYVDPTTVLLKYRKPDGTKVTLTYVTATSSSTSSLVGSTELLIRSSAGIFYVDISIDTSGVWHFKYQSTGSGQAATPDTQITVNESVF